MFAGSCIGVICLVMSLEFLRRLQREHDKYIRRQILCGRGQSAPKPHSDSENDGEIMSTNEALVSSRQRFEGRKAAWTARARPTVPQQLVRAGLHMLQFAVAYFIMLLAMYYNGECDHSSRASPDCSMEPSELGFGSHNTDM